MQINKFSYAIFLLALFRGIQADPYPLQFAIPEIKIVAEVPEKTRDFAFLIPGELRTYIYTNEPDYYQGYSQAYFALTKVKGGWDCMRHYEILACGTIPYFLDLEQCNPNTMKLLPRELILEAMNLPGVPKLNGKNFLHTPLKIDHQKFDKTRYDQILKKLLDYTRTYLTTKAMAAYFLNTIEYQGTGSILYLSDDIGPDYLRCCMLIGLKELLGQRVVDCPKIPHIYTSYPEDAVKSLYGKGFSYTRIVEDIPVDRDAIAKRIENKEFDLIIYGSVHRGLPYHDIVRTTYPSEKIVYICGEDNHTCEYSQWNNLFLREFDAYVA